MQLFQYITTLIFQLISGHQLPPSNLSKTNKADPLVHVEIYGVPEDQTKKKSSVVKSNGEYQSYSLDCEQSRIIFFKELCSILTETAFIFL